MRIWSWLGLMWRRPSLEKVEIAVPAPKDIKQQSSTYSITSACLIERLLRHALSDELSSYLFAREQDM